jgi:hypothetical protein
MMTVADLKQWILRRLGSPMVRVELTDCHLDDAVEEARRWFSARKGVVKRALFQIIPQQVEYALPDEMDTVVDVAFPSAPFDFSLLFSPFILLDEKIPYDVFAAPFSSGLYSSFTQALQYIEMAKRVIGAEQEWWQDQRTLFLAPKPENAGGMMVWYKSGVTQIEQLNERDHDLLKRYALAVAKRDLGRIRSKYDSYPTAAGTTSLDGERLLEEASSEIEALTQELMDSGPPMGFLTG